MKHKKVAALLVLFLCLIVVAGIANSPEKRTIRYFNKYREALEEELLNTAGTARVSEKLGIRFHYWDGVHPIAEYTVAGQGIVPASKYYGFFYSFDNEPVSFQNSNVPLVPVSKQEWKWSEEGGNHGIVRRLDENWFYFEAAL